MVKQTTEIEKIGRVFLLLPLFLLGCANQLPPGGGLLDTEPPVVVESFPPDGKVNYTGNYVELTFNEYIDKRSLIDALFISPTPDFPPEFDWSGKSVRIYFPGTMRKSTYTITIGTDVVDLNNRNRMASSFTTRFSSGPEIDKGYITGSVYTEKPSGVFVFAYRMDTAAVNFRERKPDYISQAGDSGRFTLSGLSPGSYRVIAVKDESKDYLFQAEQDLIGIPSRDCNLTATDTLQNGLRYFLQKMDTLRPRLISAAMTDRNHVLASFSEELALSDKTKSLFHVIDSASGMRYEPEAFFRGRGRPKEYFLSFRDSIRQSDNLFLVAGKISDESGNVNDSDAVSLFYSSRQDTTTLSVFRIEPVNNSADNVLDLKKIVIALDDYPSLSRGEFIVQDTLKKRITADRESFDDATIVLRPHTRLTPSMQYTISTDLNVWKDYSAKSLDSVFVSKFTTVSDLDLTGLFGTVKGFSKLARPMLRLQSVEKPGIEYAQTVADSGTFSFDKVNPGKYKLFFYYDVNNNGVYDKGSPLPWQYAEPCLYFDETIALTPRWAVTDLIFDVSGVIVSLPR